MLELTVVRQFHRNPNGVGLFLDNIGRTKEESFRVDGPIKMKPWDEEAYSADGVPDIQLSDTAAQKLIDGLWNAGLRPTQGSGSAGSFEAQRRHLEDMRQLVFKDKCKD